MKLYVDKTWILLFAALLLGLAASWMTMRYLQGQKARIEASLSQHQKKVASVSVVVATKDMPAGAVVGYQNMAMRDVPQDYVPNEAVMPDQFDAAQGQRLIYPVQKGKPLLWAYLDKGENKPFSDSFPAGYRAITIQVDEVNSLSGMLRPGDRIDLIAALRQGQRENVFPLLQNVPVLATGRRVRGRRPAQDDGLGERGYTTITLEVTPTDAQRIILAQQKGRITAVLRNATDYANVPGGNVHLAGLPGSGRRAAHRARQERVEYIIGGRSDKGAATVNKLPVLGLAPLLAALGQGAHAKVPAPASAPVPAASIPSNNTSGSNF